MTCASCGEGTEILFRGSTVVFRTKFYDYLGEQRSPLGAQVTITYPVQGSSIIATIDYVAPSDPLDYWIAQWDSRPAEPGICQFSVHNTGGPPFGVEDGSFDLSANRSNLTTIS